MLLWPLIYGIFLSSLTNFIAHRGWDHYTQRGWAHQTQQRPRPPNTDRSHHPTQRLRSTHSEAKATAHNRSWNQPIHLQAKTTHTEAETTPHRHRPRSLHADRGQDHRMQTETETSTHIQGPRSQLTEAETITHTGARPRPPHRDRDHQTLTENETTTHIEVPRPSNMGRDHCSRTETETTSHRDGDHQTHRNWYHHTHRDRDHHTQRPRSSYKKLRPLQTHRRRDYHTQISRPPLTGTEITARRHRGRDNQTHIEAMTTAHGGWDL